MASRLLPLPVVHDDGSESTVWVDVSGPVMVAPEAASRLGCSRLRTQVGDLCVRREPDVLVELIQEHRGVS